MAALTTELPPAYPSHRHATEEARTIARDGMILRVEVGSGVHGTSIAGTDDRDELGVCIEPPAFVTGLRRFEQFERHTAWDRAGGVRERSGHGDLDVTVYSARKFCRLALDGNPSILTALFVPFESQVYRTVLGDELLAMRRAFVSLQAANRYLGYLSSQRRGMNGVGRVNRPELIEQYGYDVKFAAHAVRLGVQGMQLMNTGEIELPMRGYHRDYIRSIREGRERQADVQQAVNQLEWALRDLRDRNPHGWPEQGDRAAVDRWLHRAHMTSWIDMTYARV